jgi:internalin A
MNKLILKIILILIVSLPLFLLSQLLLFQYSVMTPEFIRKCQWGRTEIVNRLLKQVNTNNCEEAYLRLKNAKQLYLSGDMNYWTGDDLTIIKSFYQTKNIDLSSNKITHIENLSDLKQLTKLNLSQNNIINIYPLNNLSDLTDLNLHSNKISDIIKPLARLKKITKLDLSDNNIVDLKSLDNLHELTELNLSRNKIVDLKSLANLGNLTKLDLSDNNITNIRSLRNLKNLTEFTLRGNKIEPQICPVQPASTCKF